MGLKSIKALAVLVLTIAAGFLVFECRECALLKEHHGILAQKAEHLERLEAENQRLRDLAAGLRADSPDRLRAELDGLRREAQRLRKDREEWERLCQEHRELRVRLGDGVRPWIPSTDWTYAGYGDPESAAQSSLWAGLTGNRDTILESIMPEELATWTNCSERAIDDFCNRVQRSQRNWTGFQILGQKKISDDEVIVLINVHPERPDLANLQLSLKRTGSGWKTWGLHP